MEHVSPAILLLLVPTYTLGTLCQVSAQSFTVRFPHFPCHSHVCTPTPRKGGRGQVCSFSLSPTLPSFHLPSFFPSIYSSIHSVNIYRVPGNTTLMGIMVNKTVKNPHCREAYILEKGDCRQIGKWTCWVRW